MRADNPQASAGGAEAGQRARRTAWIVAMCAWCVIGVSFLLPPRGAGVPACPSRLITGVPCPGCGLTRSVTSLSHGDPRGAWMYNPFGFAAVVVIAWYGVRPLVGLARARRFELSRPMRVLGWTLLVLFVAHGLARAVGLLPDHTAPGGGVGS